jgi:hypothetical protein
VPPLHRYPAGFFSTADLLIVADNNNDEDDFRSSDLEFEPAPPKRNPRAGAASMELLREEAFNNRIISRQEVKGLQFGKGAPGNVSLACLAQSNTILTVRFLGTRAIQDLWTNRFDIFRQGTLHQSLHTPFTHLDMERFVGRIIPKIKPKGAPIPNLSTIESGIAVLIEYGQYLYPISSGTDIPSRKRTLI